MIGSLAGYVGSPPISSWSISHQSGWVGDWRREGSGPYAIVSRASFCPKRESRSCSPVGMVLVNTAAAPTSPATGSAMSDAIRMLEPNDRRV